MRELHHTKYKNLGGNLYIEVPFPRKYGCDPNNIYHILKEGQYYATDKLPTFPFLVGRVGRITSCVAPLAKEFNFAGTKTICHSPPLAFLNTCPFDCAVIFSMDKEHLGVMHNFFEVNKKGLLTELVQ